MPRKTTPIRELFVNTQTTRTEGARGNVWSCVRCGWELVDNATRFAKHITRCPKATDADREVAASHLSSMSATQLAAINSSVEFTRAFSLGGKAHVRSLFEDTNTSRPGERAKLFRCKKCGHETTENATRFAHHILKCNKASDDERAIAYEHEALTRKRRAQRKAKQEGAQADAGQSEIALVPEEPGSSCGPSVSNSLSDSVQDDALTAILLGEVESFGSGTIVGGSEGQRTSINELDDVFFDDDNGNAEGNNSHLAATWPSDDIEPFPVTPLGPGPVTVAPHQPTADITSASAFNPESSMLCHRPSLSDDGSGVLFGADSSGQGTEGIGSLAEGLEELINGFAFAGGPTPGPEHSLFQPSTTTQAGAGVMIQIGGNSIRVPALSPPQVVSHSAPLTSAADEVPVEEIQPVALHQKRRRCETGAVAAGPISVEADEYRQYLLWKQMKHERETVPRNLASNAAMWQTLHSYFRGYAQSAAEIYQSYGATFGPASTTKLISTQIDNDWIQLASVFKTIIQCCGREYMQMVADKARSDPQRVLGLYDASIELAKDCVTIGPHLTIAKRRAVKHLLDINQQAVCNGLERAFEHLTLDDSGNPRAPNPMSVRRFMATQHFSVKTGPDMRDLILVTAGGMGRSGGEPSTSCRIPSLASTVENGELIVADEDLRTWNKANFDYLPVLEDMAADKDSAIACVAWMYEIYNKAGWDLCLVV